MRLDRVNLCQVNRDKDAAEAAALYISEGNIVNREEKGKNRE